MEIFFKILQKVPVAMAATINRNLLKKKRNLKRRKRIQPIRKMRKVLRILERAANPVPIRLVRTQCATYTLLYRHPKQQMLHFTKLFNFPFVLLLLKKLSCKLENFLLSIICVRVFSFSLFLLITRPFHPFDNDVCNNVVFFSHLFFNKFFRFFSNQHRLMMLLLFVLFCSSSCKM